MLKKMKQMKAKVINKFTQKLIVVKFLEKKYMYRKLSNRFKYGITIDPGYMNIGFALYRYDTETNSLTYLTVGVKRINTKDIKEKLLERKMYRRLRRYHRRQREKRRFGVAKFRPPRWKNRSKDPLTPTVRYLVEMHVNLVKWMQKYLPITEMCMEYDKFDTHKMKNKNIKGISYQLGPQKGFDSVKEYVKHRDSNKCVICGSTSNLEVHHVVPRSEGGTDIPDNLVTLYHSCHMKVHEKGIKVPVKQYQQVGVLNTAMPYIIGKLNSLDTIERVTTVPSYRVFECRKNNEGPKEHWYDACCVARLCYSDANLDSLIGEEVCIFIQVPRNNRANITRQEDRKYYANGKLVARNRRKRCGQTSDSLEDYLKKNPKHPNLEVKPSRRIYKKAEWWQKTGSMWYVEGQGIRIAKVYQNSIKSMEFYDESVKCGVKNYKIQLKSGRSKIRFLKCGGMTPLIHPTDRKMFSCGCVGEEYL